MAKHPQPQRAKAHGNTERGDRLQGISADEVLGKFQALFHGLFGRG